jgi:hypothetical protein
MTRKLWPLLCFFLLLSGCGSIDWFPDVTAPTTTTPTTFTAPTLTAELSPTSIASGGSSTLTLTIHNTTATLPAQTGMTFVELLPTGVTAIIGASTCGGEATVPSSSNGTKIVLTGGLLASGATSCTVKATLTATNTGTTTLSFPIQSSDFSNLAGGLVSGVTTQTLTVTPVAAAVLSPTLSASIVPAAFRDGETIPLALTITNATGNPVQAGMGFTEAIPAGLQAAVASASQCGGTLAVSGSNLTFTGGALASGVANCSLQANLSLLASNSITADTSFSVKSTDFTGLQGTLANGITTDQTFQIFPSAVSTSPAGVTVSNFVASGTADTATGTSVNFTFKADTANTTAASVNATVTVVAINKSGAQMTSTKIPLSVTIPITAVGTVNSQVVLVSSPSPFSISNTDNDNLSFWRLLTVTVQ